MKSTNRTFRQLIGGILAACTLGGCIGLCACKPDTEKEPPQEITTVEVDMTKPIENGDKIVYSGKLKYAPDHYMMWDNWTVEKDGTVYLIHLKGLIDGNLYDQEAENKRGFGLASSKDLVHWNQMDDILKVKDSANPNDVDFRYTGSAIVRNDRCYVFYTMRKWGGQRIGVAWSDDMETWTEYSGNPVLVPDPQWFISFNPSNSGYSTSSVWRDTIDCRDFLVLKDPDGEGYLGYFVASAEGIYSSSPVSVIGLARSIDLLHWTQEGIVYRPTGVSMPEMVDVFRIGSKWYMTLTTGKNNGGIDMFSDPYISRAQIYATADSPAGPFTENPEDNVVFGGQYNSGYSSRTILFRNQLRMLYTDSNNGKSVLALPKNVKVNEKGYLRTYYAEDLLKGLRTDSLSTSMAAQPFTSFGWKTHGGTWTKSGSDFRCTTDQNSWQAMLFSGTSKNLELSFTLSADSDASSLGVVLTNDTDLTDLSCLKNILVLDRRHNRVYLTDSTWELDNCRRYDFEDGTEYRVRVLLVGNTLELYINDEFVFNTGFNNLGRNRAGLFANNGTVTITDSEYYKLES